MLFLGLVGLGLDHIVFLCLLHTIVIYHVWLVYVYIHSFHIMWHKHILTLCWPVFLNFLLMDWYEKNTIIT